MDRPISWLFFFVSSLRVLLFSRALCFDGGWHCLTATTASLPAPQVPAPALPFASARIRPPSAHEAVSGQSDTKQRQQVKHRGDHPSRKRRAQNNKQPDSPCTHGVLRVRPELINAAPDHRARPGSSITTRRAQRKQPARKHDTQTDAPTRTGVLLCAGYSRLILPTAQPMPTGKTLMTFSFRYAPFTPCHFPRAAVVQP